MFWPVFDLRWRQLVFQQGHPVAASSGSEYLMLEQLDPPSDGRRKSFGQCRASGGDRRTTWRRLGGSCPMTSRFSRRSITSCASCSTFSHAHLALHALYASQDEMLCHARAKRTSER